MSHLKDKIVNQKATTLKHITENDIEHILDRLVKKKHIKIQKLYYDDDDFGILNISYALNYDIKSTARTEEK